jgi:hypothetical protein
MLCFFCSLLVALSVFWYIFSSMASDDYKYSVPSSISAGFVISHFLAGWRWGPKYAKFSVFTFTLPLFMAYTMIPMLVGPVDQVPFGSIFHFTAVIACQVTSMSIAAVSGLVPNDQPLEPHRTIWKPVLRAAVNTDRFMDAMTDMALLRVFIDEVGLWCTCSAPHIASSLACGSRHSRGLDKLGLPSNLECMRARGCKCSRPRPNAG